MIDVTEDLIAYRDCIRDLWTDHVGKCRSFPEIGGCEIHEDFSVACAYLFRIFISKRSDKHYAYLRNPLEMAYPFRHAIDFLEIRIPDRVDGLRFREGTSHGIWEETAIGPVTLKYLDVFDIAETDPVREFGWIKGIDPTGEIVLVPIASGFSAFLLA